MIELLRRFGGKFRRYMVIGPACKLIEVIFDLLTPLVIAQMIDKGIGAHDVNAVVRYGAVLAAMAVNRPVFWTAANLAGLAMGSSQSAGRAIVAILSPKTRSAEFFSFWNMALWLAAIVGPLAYGSVTWITNNDHRLAICVTGLFFAAAVLALIPVNLERGRRVAEETDAASRGTTSDH